MFLSRRAFLATAITPSSVRNFHLSVSPEALDRDPELPGVVRTAGVADVWIGAFHYGHWYYTPERIAAQRKAWERAGMRTHVIQVPLGHPGDSLGSADGQLPLIPPPHWKPCVRSDGKIQWGTSLHPPATAENVDAIRRIASLGVRRAFVDDDFRLAQGPGTIGGCYCDAHITEFARRYGYGAPVREQLLEAVRARRLDTVVRNWVAYTCDQLSDCFRAIQKGAPEIDLGIMVMYLGAEKAGIRLDDYRGVPFRVGELMFDDKSFGRVKGKTNELFSSLFHRHFAAPERAYSETTAFPADRLSARNMAAKLAISTLSDVRHTMMMSGATPFPRTHWDTLAPAMRKQAAVHARVAGHTPRGPFKHWWGEASRYVGNDNPYSLFLAAGVPFEVCDAPPREGWAFLSDADADSFRSAATAVTRKAVPETLADLYALKRQIKKALHDVPFVEDEKPVVCSWLPTARRVLLWNLAEQRETFSLIYRGKRREIAADGLDLVEVKL
jgi:hypothetical protein